MHTSALGTPSTHGSLHKLAGIGGKREISRLTELLEEHKNSNVDEVDEYGMTPLCWACRAGNKEVVGRSLIRQTCFVTQFLALIRGTS